MEDIDKSSEETLFFRRKEEKHTNDYVEKLSKEIGTPSSETRKSTQSKNDGVSNENEDNLVVPLAAFRTWKKLPKRLNVWVFQLDPENPIDLSTSEGGGFPRPELLPIADIFRSFGD